MESTYEVLLAHPDLVGLYLARQGARGPNAQRLGDVMRTWLAALGVDGVRAREALDVLIVYAIGFAAYAAAASGPPGVAAHPPDHPRASREDLRRTFDTGLRWLLAGIAR